VGGINFSILKIGFLACVLWQPPGAMAHLPEHYGREYVRFEEPSLDIERQPDTSASVDQPAGDLSDYEKQLDGAARSGGPYAAGLTDPLMGMAQYYVQQGKLEDALDTYRKALHLVRLNDGLYSERQIPILREMMDIYRQRGDYQSLDEAHQYYSRLRNLDKMPHTLEWLDTGIEYLIWEQELYASGAVSNRRAPLMRAYRVNQSMLESLKPTSDEELGWHFRLCLSQMRNLYLIMGDDYLSMSASLNSGEGPAVDAVNREFAFVQKTALRKGQKLLEQCIDIAQLSPAASLAALHLELGDWHQWNDELRLATRQYERVVEVLRAAGEEKLLLKWLDQPVELPDESNLWAANPYTNVPSQVVVEARYNVTSRGDVRKIKVSVAEEQEEKEWQAWRIKRMLSDTHFRPRFSQGQAEMVEQISRRYLLVGAH